MSTGPIDLLATAFFVGCDSAILNGNLKRDAAAAIAHQFVQAEYPSALCSFLFGSSFRDAFSRFSDLDLVIVDIEPTHYGARRYVFGGCPIEAHLFDRKGILKALQDAVTSGRVNVSLGLASSALVTDIIGLGGELQDLAALLIKRGPPPMSEDIARLAYCTIITSILEIANNPSEDERFATITTLQPKMMNFYFAARREWANARKWAVKDAPGFAKRLNHALQQAYRSGDVDILALILQDLAEPWPVLTWAGAHASVFSL